MNKKMFLTIVVVLILALLIGALTRIFKKDETITTEVTVIDEHALTYTEADYDVKPKTITVSSEKPEAMAYGVKIHYSEYALDGEEQLEVKELPVKVDKDLGLKITAYDFKMSEQTEFEDVITIAIPYDSEYVEEGAEGECVGAKYYNTNTGEWEGVYYEVDAKNEQVFIYTTHFSTYGIFQIKNENTRRAYIQDVYAICNSIDSDTSYRVLEELSTNGKAGETAFQAGFNIVNKVVGDIGASMSVATLGGQYEGALVESLGGVFQHTGLALSVVQTCYDFTYNFGDDNAKKATLANMIKNITNNAVGYFGSAAMQVGFAGVYVFDVLLSTVQSDMVELKLENIGEVYQYYNDVESPRSNKEWRRMFIQILEANKDNPDKAKELIDQEIDHFCDRFWALDYGKQKEIAGVAGKGTMFDQNDADAKTLTAQYKTYLLNKLQAPLTSARNYLLNKAMETARKDLDTELRKLQRELNKVIQVQIIEEPEEEGELQYSGYTVRFAPLSGMANPKNWSGIITESGTLSTSFTILGHMQCGSPNTVELYKPGDDSPSLTVSFKVNYPTTTILLRSNGEEKSPTDKEDDRESEDTEESKDGIVSETDFAWVYLGTETNDWQASLDEVNQDSPWKQEINASEGSVLFKVTYIGTDESAWVKTGMSQSGSVTWTSPTLKLIHPNEEFSVDIASEHLGRDHDNFAGIGQIYAQILRLNEEGEQTSADYMVAEDGEYWLSSTSSNGYQSFARTVVGTIGSGYAEGEKMSICIGASNGNVGIQTSYIYEWRKQ